MKEDENLDNEFADIIEKNINKDHIIVLILYIIVIILFILLILGINKQKDIIKNNVEITLIEKKI